MRTLRLAVALLMGLSLQGTAFAQFPPGSQSYDVYQNGVLAGELYVEGSGSTYTEHWVLFPNYKAPSGSNALSTTVVPGLKTYVDTKEFFAKVSFLAGSRYVKSACQEDAKLPGR
jgi:hypothetical protein